MSIDLLAEEARLRERRRPYATAVVVRVRHPAAAQPGDRALVSDDGRLMGWVGGSCTEPVVVREAVKAMADGAVRMLRLGPPDRLTADDRDDVVVVPLTCVSEGEIEVLVVPQLPVPHVLTLGAAPVLDALVDVARRVGYAAERLDLAGLDADGVRRAVESAASPESYVLVATFGRYDEDAVAAALAAGVDYVALVASRRRAETVRAALAELGTSPEDLARLRAPAGLDLGSLQHLEVAVALFADIVATESARRSQSLVPAPRSAPEGLLDPVCGMVVDSASAAGVLTYGGVRYGFCSAGCRRRFVTDPASFVRPASPASPAS